MKCGEVFTFEKDYAPVDGCTVSAKEDAEGMISHFSLAANTSISPEIYPAEKLIIVQSGRLDITSGKGAQVSAQAGEVYVVPRSVACGVKSENGSIYTEINMGKEMNMNKVLEAGKTFELKELVPYQEGKIINMDLIDEEKMKYVVMSFDAGCALQEHAAPGDAIVTALDGEGIIGYEGKEYTLHAGESFRFAKNGRHYVKAARRFKMSLLLTL